MNKVSKKINLKELSDKEVVSLLKKGKTEAFEELISRYEAKVYNMALRLTRNREDAEEVAQDVFTVIFQKIDGFKGDSAFSSWLYRVIANAAFMKLRKRKQHPTTGLEDLSPSLRNEYLERDSRARTWNEGLPVQQELQRVIQSAIFKLPEQYRAVFVLRDVDGLSNEETGEVLGLSIPAVKSRLHRSRSMLKKRLQAYYMDFTGRTRLAANG